MRGTPPGTFSHTIRGTVHPRVCGEHGPPVGPSQAGRGSSPRVRGTPVHPDSAPRERRFIPACAGNTRAASKASPAISVHPRVCGEHLDYAIIDSYTYGSSPRVRGTRTRPVSRSSSKAVHPRVCGEHPRRSRRTSPRCRFIPACAGNTGLWPSVPVPVPVHPRVCGEHATARPRVPRASRFIPACAGNTVGGVEAAGRLAVHPRVCGEHALRRAVNSPVAGSSPRVRGTSAAASDDLRHERFIPACAGNTQDQVGRRDPAAVHPRVCGEHRFHRFLKSFHCGSSPRVRGTHIYPRPEKRGDRFIPACAGNTGDEHVVLREVPVHPRVCGEHSRCRRFRRHSPGSSPRVRGTLRTPRPPSAPSTVHPRVCGEHTRVGGTNHDGSGSSPRVRGTPQCHRRETPQDRFIPACAGNTARRAALAVTGTVHPRVCGEHSLRAHRMWRIIGSSPRVRGTL